MHLAHLEKIALVEFFFWVGLASKFDQAFFGLLVVCLLNQKCAHILCKFEFVPSVAENYHPSSIAVAWFIDCFHPHSNPGHGILFNVFTNWSRE